MRHMILGFLHIWVVTLDQNKHSALMPPFLALYVGTKNMQGNPLGRLHIRMIFHHLYRISGTHGIVFLCPRGKADTRLASSEIVSDQLDHWSAFSTEREIWSVARFYGLAATTDKGKRRERASVSLRKTDSPLRRKLRKRKRRER